MSNNKKNRKKKGDNKQYSLIPNNAIFTTKGKIPSPKISEAENIEETTSISLVFDGYIHNKCDISNFTKVETEELIKKLNEICSYNKKEIFTHKTGLKFDQINKIGKDNDYKRLFSKIIDQVNGEIWEIRFGSNNNSSKRIFGYFVKSIFVILLIKNEHLKINN